MIYTILEPQWRQTLDTLELTSNFYKQSLLLFKIPSTHFVLLLWCLPFQTQQINCFHYFPLSLSKIRLQCRAHGDFTNPSL